MEVAGWQFKYLAKSCMLKMLTNIFVILAFSLHIYLGHTVLEY